MKTHPKTVEQARQLPYIELKSWPAEPRELSPIPLEGDGILLFVDSDGRPMEVITHEGGFWKTPASI